jgi:cytochrome P450
MEKRPSHDPPKNEPMGDPLVVDMRGATFWQDPYPIWRAAREQNRTAQTPAGEPILLSAEDHDVVSADPAFAMLGLDALRRLGIVDGPFFAWRRLTLATLDGEQHERLRSVVGRSFTPRRVDMLRTALRAHAEGLLDEAAERGHLDVVADYALGLPLWVICRFLGLPEDIDDEIAVFLVGTEEGFTDPMTPERRGRAEAGIVALYDVVSRLIDERRRSPREDLVTDLVEAQAAGRLDDDELHALVVNIIGGAVGSSRAAIANSALLFLTHPDQARTLRGDPTLLKPAVEECLRIHPPFRSGRRKVVASVQRFGLSLEPGDTVVLARQAANRDPSRWNDADRFDIGREERRHHSFGYGPHFCLGHALARVDLHEAIGAFVARIDDYELVDVDPIRQPAVADEALERLRVTVRSGKVSR